MSLSRGKHLALVAVGLGLVITATSQAAGAAPSGVPNGRHSLAEVARVFAANGLPLMRLSVGSARTPFELVPRELALRSDISVAVFPEGQAITGIRLVIGIRHGQPQRLVTLGNVVVRLSAGAS